MFVRYSTVRYSARAVVALLTFAALSAALPARAGFNQFTVGGSTAPGTIQPTVDAFRAALGNPNNGNNPGPLGAGRREINWDGGGAMVSAATGTPMTTFINNRGATMTTAGTGFLQTPLEDPALGAINPAYETTFNFFSAQRIFTPLGSNVTDVTFTIPGSNGATPAAVKGFGAVFSDVGLAATTKLEFFSAANLSLFVLDVPTGAPGGATSASLSFAGAIANAGELIARVRITTGNQVLGLADSNGNPVDVVAMDDFIYAEPVPEPASAALAILGLCGVRLAKTARYPR